MKDILLGLLNRLKAIGDTSEELYDTDVRQAMGDAVIDGYVRAEHDYAIPEDFGMFSPEANAAVRKALLDYMLAANQKAAELGISRFHDRLATLQDRSVQIDEHRDYEDFLGHVRSDVYDAQGNVTSNGRRG